MNSIEEIIKGCQRNEKSAQEALYQKMAPPLLAICSRYFDDKSVAEDILHDAIIQIFDQINQLRSAKAFASWTKRIAINKALNYIRDEKIFQNIDHNSSGNLEALDLTEGSTSMYQEDFMTILSLLPRQRRIIFSLYEIEGYSHKDIANELKISEASSRSQLADAKKNLITIHKKLNSPSD